IGARHSRPPLEFPCHPRDGRMCRIAFRITCRLESIGADLSRVGRVKYLKKVTHGSFVQHKKPVHGAARARSTISERSRERGDVALMRLRAPSAFACRPRSIMRQLRKAVASRAETCGFFWSSASTVSATKS